MYYVLYDHGRNSVLYEQYEKHKNIFLSGCLQMSQNNVRTKELMMSGCLKAWALNSSSLLSCDACCCCCGRIESAAATAVAEECVAASYSYKQLRHLWPST